MDKVLIAAYVMGCWLLAGCIGAGIYSLVATIAKRRAS